MSEQGNYNVLVEVKKTTIWLRKKDAEKPIDGRIKNQGVIMIENKIILIEDDKEIRGMINDYLSGEFEVTAFNDGMSAIQKITSYDEYALALIDLMLPDISGMEIISMTDPKQVKDTFESTYLVIGLLMSFIFLVYSSVLTAKLVIGEYNHRTITIMFSYPLNRIKLIASKLTIIMVYTAISMTIGYICCSSYIIFADKSFNMLEGTFQPSMLRTWIPMAITTVIICMVLSLWSFIIGMIRKSVPATIVTSLIVIVLRQVIITKNTTNQESIMQVILVAIVTVIATLLIFKRKVPELY